MEIQVKLYCPENDSYVELWKIVGKDQYIGRFTYGQKQWVYVCDPLGYCEIDGVISNDITVIVCDQEGTELFRTNNGDGSANFNTPKEEAFAQWKSFTEQSLINATVEDQNVLFYVHWATGDPAGKFNDWLLSFKDPDAYPEAKDYQENWLYCMAENIGEPEQLSTYAYLGEELHIERVRCRHKVCGAVWSEYYSGGQFIGTDFDESICGPMYAEGTAKRLAKEAIRTHFAAYENVSVVSKCGPPTASYYVQHNLRLSEAADYLLNGNFHKDAVDAAVAAEAKKTQFFKCGFRGIEAIRAIYPDCVEDHHFLI